MYNKEQDLVDLLSSPEEALYPLWWQCPRAFACVFKPNEADSPVQPCRRLPTFQLRLLGVNDMVFRGGVKAPKHGVIMPEASFP